MEIDFLPKFQRIGSDFPYLETKSAKQKETKPFESVQVHRFHDVPILVVGEQFHEPGSSVWEQKGSRKGRIYPYMFDDQFVYRISRRPKLKD